jgi:type VI secretion system secreted protein VgrG
MSTYTQAERPLKITTPLGPDVLLITDFRGREAISRLFQFQLNLIADRQKLSEIRFDRILGQSVTVEMTLRTGDTRHFNGLVRRFTQGVRDDNFVAFSAEVVPRLWVLTRKVQSRIFQHVSVPDILKRVLSDHHVDHEWTGTGTYYPRDYCVQYRESDLDFVSRLMEEEGICYYFKHSAGGHRMVVTDQGDVHPAVPGESTIIYQEIFGGVWEDMRIRDWEKSQELRSTKYTVWDHSFELPGKHLDESVRTMVEVNAGSISHKLSLLDNQPEIYEYPGGYAKQFNVPEDTNLIPEVRNRIVRVRMEEEECAGLEITGAGDCGNFAPGHRFTLKGHFNGDGDYLLTSVEHDAAQSGYRSGEQDSFRYENRFCGMPTGLKYRPRRVTAKPQIAGFETATVTGPPGEEIFCDQFGRIKVQFHWDREGKLDDNSSCWLRVAQLWAGKGWGAFFWPRIGHEVVVTFEDGDPDQPLIVGSVYNKENMPAYKLPDMKQLAGIRSATVRGSAHESYNGIVFNDEKGSEHLGLHSERNMALNSEFDKMFHGKNKGERIAGASVHTVGILPGGSGRGDSGGGSGGGDDESYSTGHTMPAKDEPTALGIKSDVVYGAAQLLTLGFDHGLVIGNKNRICINPLFLLASPPWFSTILGGGLGGQVDFFMGTKTDFVWGPSFKIELGEEALKLKRNVRAVPVVHWLAIAFGAVSALWVLVHSACKEDKDRAIFGGICQTVSSVLLTFIVWAGKNFQEKFDKPADKFHGKVNAVRLRALLAQGVAWEKK